jgi:hypothetical protein
MSQLDLFAPPQILKRSQAIEKLQPYLGNNLRKVAEDIGILPPHTIPQNKGWAGHTVEALLGKSPDNQQAPDFGDWELKVLPIVQNADSSALVIKSNLAITMFQAKNVYDCSFEESHLFAKTQHMLLALRLYQDIQELYSPLYALASYDLQTPIREQIAEEYENIRWLLHNQGIMGLKNFTGQFLSLYTKGKETHLWRFYAQKHWISYMLQQNLILTKTH